MSSIIVLDSSDEDEVNYIEKNFKKMNEKRGKKVLCVCRFLC